jgi:hypothetical protein
MLGKSPNSFGKPLLSQQKSAADACDRLRSYCLHDQIHRVVAVLGYDVALAPRSHQERVVLDDLHASAIQALN